MATKNQIYEALKFANRSMPERREYQSLHRSITSIHTGQKQMSSDIREISTYVRSGNGNDK
jgi:hypothetical protein